MVVRRKKSTGAAKKPSKRVVKLARKYKVKITIKRGSRRVYKTTKLILQQIQRKKKSTTRKTRKTTKFGKSWWLSPIGSSSARPESINYNECNRLRQIAEQQKFVKDLDENPKGYEYVVEKLNRHIKTVCTNKYLSPVKKDNELLRLVRDLENEVKRTEKNICDRFTKLARNHKLATDLEKNPGNYISNAYTVINQQLGQMCRPGNYYSVREKDRDTILKRSLDSLQGQLLKRI